MIVLKNVTKRYRTSSEPVLRGVDLTCESGELVWIAGDSGSGKTTLLNVLGLLSEVDSGSFSIDGVELLGAPERTRRDARANLVSTVFQTGNLFGHLTVGTNVALGLPRANPEAVAQALRDVDMEDKQETRAGLLSGGEHQRVAIARAMARGSRLLLADEPFASLDTRNAERVMGLLQKVAAAGTTVVLVSHDARAGAVATDRRLLAKGRLT
ncbi:ABC transporter ATP-binding protein [Oerskovia turbata]